MQVKYNEPIEVTKEQYIKISIYWKGICAFRKTETQYFVKLLVPAYSQELASFLSK